MSDTEAERRQYAMWSNCDLTTDGDTDLMDFGEHTAYANPVDGGHAGYQAACHDCSWKGPHRQNKDDARADAETHDTQPNPNLVRVTALLASSPEALGDLKAFARSYLSLDPLVPMDVSARRRTLARRIVDGM